MPSSSSIVRDRARLARVAEVRFERDRVERHERVDDLAHLARAAQQPDVGTAVRDDAEILRRRAAQRADEGHGLAPRTPAADADGHAVVHLGRDLVDGDALVGNHSQLDSDGAADRRRGGIAPGPTAADPVRRVPECPADGRSSLRRAGRDRHRRLPRHRPRHRPALRRRPARSVLVCCRNEPESLPDGVAFVAADVREPEQIDAVIAELRRAVRAPSTCWSTTRVARRPPTPRPRRRASPPGIIALNLTAPIVFAQRANAVMQAQDARRDDRQHRQRQRGAAVAEHARLRRGQGRAPERDPDDGGRVRAEGARQRGRRRARRHRAGAPLLRRRGGDRRGGRDRAARAHGRPDRHRRRVPVPRVAARPLRQRRARCSCTAAASNPRTWTPRREPCATDADRRVRCRRGRRRDRRAAVRARHRRGRDRARRALRGHARQRDAARRSRPRGDPADSRSSTSPRASTGAPTTSCSSTTKTQDSTARSTRLAAAAGPDVPVVCVQNGVENERIALRRFAHVYAICVMLPGRAPRARRRRRVVGAGERACSTSAAIPSGVDDVATAGRGRACRAATFESIPRPDVMRWKYRKLLMNLANAVEALCEPGDDANELGRRGPPRRLRGAARRRASTSRRSKRIASGAATGSRPAWRAGGGSTWQSLRRGTGSLETDYLNGEIALLRPTPRHGEPGERVAADGGERRGPAQAPARLAAGIGPAQGCCDVSRPPVRDRGFVRGLGREQHGADRLERLRRRFEHLQDSRA